MPEKTADGPRVIVRDRARSVIPADAREAADQEDILRWVDSGAPLFRTEKPAVPPRHLAVYAALLDDAGRAVMLVDHKKARAWLPAGGHVDPGEDPRRTVRRETAEELRLSPEFHEKFGSQPYFLSVTRTRGEGSHTDVTMWFVLEGDPEAEVHPDLGEFSEVRWFSLDETDWAAECFDPHMERFVGKLKAVLDEPAAR